MVSSEQGIVDLYKAVPSHNNGLIFCTRFFCVRADIALAGIVERLGSKIYLRATKRDAEGNFHEVDHLHGDVDIFAVMKAVVLE
ncbi:hypothetical protein BTO15_16215 [Polaribacter sejongensis]|uniref:mannonate dehydratase n=1 Tax=Polaribacter sejongensis TaxID=985043 RepID=A0AAJ1QXM5_9FLAO|nr:MULTISPECIES: mannonate dehydratase [Polaribacter]AUC23549.1 hypothetical protein BTO15_16215 [Polaribacter sejongensis]MDN3620091.1 mannonate dehydratase [Polaribacter undariae]UWD32238.1 mannonate dehydratase [Polaribacter undariae]